MGSIEPKCGRNLVHIWDMTGKMRRVAVFEGGILLTFCSRWEPAQIPEWFLRIAVSSLRVATGESPGKSSDESPF
jgi:hypothetical protein